MTVKSTKPLSRARDRHVRPRRTVWIVSVLVTIVLFGSIRMVASADPSTGSADVAVAPAPPHGAPVFRFASYRSRMPAGFEHSEAGAESAGIAFAAEVEQQMLYLDDPAREQGQREISAAARVETLASERQRRSAEWRQTLQGGQGQLWWVVTPLARRLETYTNQQARVEVWVAFVVSRQGAAAPKVWFGTSTVDLVWERDDWRVWGQSLSDGPTPQLSQTAKPSDANELASQLDGFRLVKGAQ